jgi:hypothetical protein
MIWKFLPILAQAPAPLPITPEDLKGAPTHLPGFHMNDALTVIAATLVVVALLVVWAIFFRKPQTDAGRTRVYKSRPTEEETEDGRIRKRKRVKRPRREHRSRNPTLAEAGGLPPVKPDNTPPPI